MRRLIAMAIIAAATLLLVSASCCAQGETAPTPSPSPSTSPDLEAARKAYGALRAMKSATSSPVTYEDYSRRLGDCKAVVLPYLEDHESSILSVEMRKALEAYDDAHSLWVHAKQSREAYLKSNDEVMGALARKYVTLLNDVKATPEGYSWVEGYSVLSAIRTLRQYAGASIHRVGTLIRDAEKPAQ